MATTTFPPLPEDKLRTLDQLRQRLNQLSTSLGSLKADLERGEPVPTWNSLQSSAQIISHNLGQILVTFESHREFLRAAHTYPLTSFPAHTQEALLNQLLRKRLEPSVEDWIKQHEKPEQGTQTSAQLPAAQLKALWAAAGPTSNAVVKSMIEDDAFEDDFTLAERQDGVENVVTGLRRKMWEDDSEDEADKAEDMEDVQQAKDTSSPIFNMDATKPAMPIESVLRFMSRGNMVR